MNQTPDSMVPKNRLSICAYLWCSVPLSSPLPWLVPYLLEIGNDLNLWSSNAKTFCVSKPMKHFITRRQCNCIHYAWFMVSIKIPMKHSGRFGTPIQGDQNEPRRFAGKWLKPTEPEVAIRPMIPIETQSSPEVCSHWKNSGGGTQESENDRT